MTKTAEGHTCHICGGPMEDRLVTYRDPWGGKLSLVENTPALVCVQCGEIYIDGNTWRRLDEIAQCPPEPLRVESVPVYDFTS